MGRLTVTIATGLRADGCDEGIYAFVAHLFSSWREDLTQVYDSGEEGVMLYGISNPYAPVFLHYPNKR